MTKYSVNILADGDWTGIALFADTCDLQAMIDFCNSQFDCGNSLTTPADDICVLDMDTGEIMWQWSDDHPDINDDDWGYNEDMGRGI